MEPAIRTILKQFTEVFIGPTKYTPDGKENLIDIAPCGKQGS
jgi:hypothetical protein